MKLSEQAQLCCLAYKLYKETEYSFCKRLEQSPLLKGYSIQCFAEDGMEGYVAFDARKYHAVVVFRGTEEVSDVFADVFVSRTLTPFGKGLVHRGCASQLLNGWNTVCALLENKAPMAITCIGHSLGGMLATLTAAWYASVGVVTTLTTFGSPPIGDSTFCEYLKEKLEHQMEGRKKKVTITHVVNGADIVPRLWLPRLLGFKLPGVVYYLTTDGTFIKNPSWWLKLCDRLGCMWRTKSVKVCLSSHSCADYASALEAVKL